MARIVSGFPGGGPLFRRRGSLGPHASREATADFTATLEVTPLIAGLKLPATQGRGCKFHNLQLQTIRN
jgi:hypothetical protein